MLITIVMGARPNFVKAAPIVRELSKRAVPVRLIHTGQHTEAMSDPIVRELELPRCDLRLHAKGSHAEMTAAVMVGVEQDLVANRPDWLVVLGDVNSSLGAALAAVKLDVKIAHVEAGYRSDDWSMPEEVNRVLVDRMSDLLLCPDKESMYAAFDSPVWKHLKPGAKYVCVGNVMMDSLRWAMEKLTHNYRYSIDVRKHPAQFMSGPYAVLTVHRPSNVDDDMSFLRTMHTAEVAAGERRLPIIWPVHPRVQQNPMPNWKTIRIDPLGYLDMVRLLRDASLVITDSGGVLEESLMLNKEIVSLRDPTKNERQHLLDHGVPEIWKTDAAPRIVDALLER